MQLQLAGGVIHPVGVNVQAAGLLTQRVDEGVAHLAEAGRLVGAAGEDNLDVRAVIGGGPGDGAWDGDQAGSAEQRGSAQTNQATG